MFSLENTINHVKSEIIAEYKAQNPSITKNELKNMKKKDDYKCEIINRVQTIIQEEFKTKENQDILSRIHQLKPIETTSIEKNIITKIEKQLNSNKLYFMVGKQLFKLKEDNLERFYNLFDDDDYLNNIIIAKDSSIPISVKENRISLEEKYFSLLRYVSMYSTLYGFYLKRDVILENYEVITIQQYIESMFYSEYVSFVERIQRKLTPVNLLKQIFANPSYSMLKKKYHANNLLLKEIPTDLTELYPKARVLNRHFILHIGDTNTGKTYEAIQELKQCESGVYLAPLRLLALEIQERLNNEGVICSMSTGEEEDIRENAKHMSSTVEKLNLEQYYNVCVLDEAQMIEDEDRGWAWTTAILGVYADRIHICMSENARDIIIQLIELCGDTYEIVEHTRTTELCMEQSPFLFHKNIRPHDALIVFSRAKVLRVAGELENMGIKASVIYGSLPYSVRKNEIRKFIEGENTVIVSTDAIGMGMNLPIERIIFLESMKFDGKSQRMLKTPEVKQIAGRAGRQGLYPIGYVNAMVDKEEIESILNQPYQPITKARIQIPKSLINLDMKLSDILKSWELLPDEGCFQKCSIKQALHLCLLLEDTVSLPKATMLELINIPFDERNEQLENLWLNLILCHFKGEDILYGVDIPEFEDTDTLEELETKYKKYDLLFSFAKVVGYDENGFLENITRLKEELAIAIMNELSTKQISRTCRCCKRLLPWDYPYSICNNCHKQRRYLY